MEGVARAFSISVGKFGALGVVVIDGHAFSGNFSGIVRSIQQSYTVGVIGTLSRRVHAAATTSG